MNEANELAAQLSEIISVASKDGRRFIVAIDGRCASGKTTLADALSKRHKCAVIHMDHFFLRPEQRTPERLATPGGNLDRERFLEEVLLPLKRNASVTYRPFNCSTMSLGSPITLPDVPLYIVEGSYACHPDMQKYYDLRVFLTVSKEEQIRRIVDRNGNTAAETFRTRWIPLEEAYFSAFNISDACDRVFET